MGCSKGGVSIVIPTYNSSGCILDALFSIVRQTVSAPIEIVIIDDNSNDFEKLKHVVTTFFSTRCNNQLSFVLIKNEINLGGGYSRNIGIENAKYQFIAFMDSDDIWCENKLSSQIMSYKPNSILTSAVLKGPSIKESIVLPKEKKRVNETVSDALFVHNKLIQTSTFFMSSDIAKKIKFNPSLPRHQDYDFLLRAEAAGYFIIQDEQPLSFWRVEDASTNRFIKKKATPEFFINWFGEYRKYMTTDAAIAYVSKNIFSACMITKKYSLFNDFYFSEAFSILERCKIIVGIVSWRMKKIRDDK